MNIRRRRGSEAAQPKEWNAAKAIYTALMGVLLVPGYFYVICTYTEPTFGGAPYAFPAIFWVLRCVTAVMALAIGKLWKDKGFLILTGYLLLKFLRVYLDTPASVFESTVSESLLCGLWVFSACYGLGHILSPKQIRGFFRICAVLWTVGAVIYAAIGIYAAWTDLQISNPDGLAYWTLADGGRLFLIYFVTVSGAVLSISAMIALCGMLTEKHMITRVLYGVAALIMLLALSLCDSRTAQVTVSAGIGMTVGIMILRLHRGREKRPWYAWALAVAAAGACFAVSVVAIMKTISVFSELKLRGGVLVSSALADGNGVAISNRGYKGGEAMLTSRPMIWRSAVNYMLQNRKVLLYGTSILNPMNGVNATPPLTFWASHCHCMPLMILLENGIPGVILVGCFLVYIGVCAFRIATSKKKPLWQMLIPAVIVSVLAGELVECFTWLRAGQVPVLPFVFVAMGFVSATGRKKNQLTNMKEEIVG